MLATWIHKLILHTFLELHGGQETNSFEFPAMNGYVRLPWNTSGVVTDQYVKIMRITKHGPHELVEFGLVAGQITNFRPIRGFRFYIQQGRIVCSRDILVLCLAVGFFCRISFCAH